MPNARHVLALLLGAALIASACAPAPATTSPGESSGAAPSGSPAPSGSDAAAASRSPSCASLEAPPDEGRAHLADGETWSYDSYPPTSGPHAITPAKPGWYDASPPIEQLVHSLEHGFIVVYRSGLKGTDETALKTRFDALVADGFDALISVPDESIKDPMTLTAWDRLQRCVSADPDAFEGFVRDHYAQAPEASVACSFQGAPDLEVCKALLANGSPAPSRSPTSADDALLTRIPQALRAACRPTSTLADGADAGWDCFPVGGDLVYGYASFPSGTARDGYFDGIVSTLGQTPTSDCAAGTTGLGPFTRADGSSGQLACAEANGTRAYYWTIDGSNDLGAALGRGETDLRAFWESAGPLPTP
ncbi:MAG TPA: DUF3105 domain-containing protein [Candidatus Limnocylindrales bacterium]